MSVRRVVRMQKTLCQKWLPSGSVADREKVFNQHQAVWGSWAMSWRADDPEALIAKDKQLTLLFDTGCSLGSNTLLKWCCVICLIFEIMYAVLSTALSTSMTICLCSVLLCSISPNFFTSPCVFHFLPPPDIFFSEHDPIANILPHLETFGDRRAFWLPGVSLLKWTFLNDIVNRLFL